MKNSRRSICPKVKIVLEQDSDPPVNRLMLKRLEIAANIMAKKNTDRGDCWKATGVMGAFVEIHTCFSRLKEMVWNRVMKTRDKTWKEELYNVTQDMRNFTILLEMAVEANLPWGDDSEASLPYNKIPMDARRKHGKA